MCNILLEFCRIDLKELNGSWLASANARYLRLWACAHSTCTFRFDTDEWLAANYRSGSGLEEQEEEEKKETPSEAKSFQLQTIPGIGAS